MRDGMTKPTVRFGVQTGQQESTWPELRDTWLELEELGFDDLWVYDHYLPTGTSHQEGPVTDAWTLLAALSQIVKKPRLGTLVTSATFRHPAALAKIATTVDHTSNGRLTLGLGAGWHQPEHIAYGIPFPGIRGRINRLEETVRVIKLLWTQERADFQGRYYRLADAPFEPKPVQKPHPPILIGGSGEKLTLPMVARVADDWNWNITGTPQDYRQKLDILHQHCNAAGRDPRTLALSLNMDFLISEDNARISSALKINAEDGGVPVETIRERMLVGSPDEVGSRLQTFIDMGVTTFMFSLRAPFDAEGKATLPDMDRRALRYHTTMDDVRRMAREVLPALRQKNNQHD